MLQINELINEKELNNSIDDTIDSLLQNEYIRNFIYKNDIPQKEVEEALNILLEYVGDTIINSDGVYESKEVKGFKMILKYSYHKISKTYVPIDVKEYNKKKIKSYGASSEMLDCTFDDLVLSNDERKRLYQYSKKFINTFKTKDQAKGLYIWGGFRTGKTYFASAIANEIIEKGYDVTLVYYPELSSLLKSTFKDDSNENFKNIIDNLKNTDLLILDDFGGEAINPYIRDEALGVVLNFRMNKNKATIFTSNIPQNKLVDVALRKDNSEQERIKAIRIYERIKEITVEYILTEKYIENKSSIE